MTVDDVTRKNWQNATTPSGEAQKSSRKQAMIDFWANNGLAWKDTCSVAGCEGKFEHGAHIRQGTGVIYLVKMCTAHNEKKKTLGSFDLKKDAPLIRAVDLP
jgi:hypothetical protein